MSKRIVFGEEGKPRSFRSAVRDLLREFEKARKGKRAEFAEIRSYVRKKGRALLDECWDELFENGLDSVLRQELRNGKFGPRHVPAHPNVIEDTGRLDDEGKPIQTQFYYSMEAMIEHQNVDAATALINARAKDVRSRGRITNNLWATFKDQVLGFQMEMPFPSFDLDKPSDRSTEEDDGEE